jgi:replicative DNA helicase
MQYQIEPELMPLFELAASIQRKCLAERADPTAIISYASQALAKLSSSAPDGAIMTWEESFEFHAKIMAERKAASETETKSAMTWLWPSWNAYLDPPEAGTLVVISAPDGAGKTAVAEAQAEHLAKLGFNVGFVHYELGKVMMTDRRAARNASVTRRALREYSLSENDLLRLELVSRKMQGYPGEITYIHTPGWTVERTTQALASLYAAGRLDIVIIDYLEKIATSNAQLRRYGHNLFAREADAVEQLKTFGERYGIPVVLLTQFSKAGKSQDFTNVTRMSIRGAGEKTEKANVVILLHRARDESGNYSPIVNVKIDKNTFGPTGSFRQYFDGRFFRLSEIATPPTAADTDTATAEVLGQDDLELSL